MGLLLKEALKCLCGDGGWSYAVFWKISCRNPMLLMWEEGHYEFARHSGVSSISAPENPELLLKGWEALWNPTELCSSEGEAQAEDKVSTVFNQMLHQVHVVGEGLVGHVAFTGKHQWVFRETYMGEMYSARPIDCSTDSQGPAGCYHQFSARIQTIAAIPVLPEGVVQLGSTQTIMENMEFVNNVQMLIMQLKRVPGAFLPENTQKAVGQRYVSLGTSVPALPSRNPCAKVGSSLPFVGNSCERHILKPPALRFLSQPSTFSTQNMQTNASALLLTSGSINSSTESFGYIFQKPNIPLGTQMENGARGAQVIISNPNVQLNQQFAQYNSSSGSSHQLSVVGSGVSSSIRTPIEQQILSGVGFEGPIKKPPYNKTSMPLQRPYGSTTPGSPNDCTIVDPLFGRDGTLNTGNCLGVLNSTPRGTLKSVDTCQSCQSIGSAGLQSANLPTLLPSSNHQNNSINVPVISGESWPGHSSTVNRHDQTARATRQGQVDNDLFQALAFLMAGSGGDEHPALFKGISGFVEDSSESCLNPLKESRGSASCEENGTVIANYEISTKGPHNYNPIDTVKENALDTLGQDFSINHLHLNLDDLLVQEGQNLRGASCISGSDLVPVFDDTGRGYFSEAKPDHLLDAVVSKFCSSSNQNSDDNSSCKTTLTKIASPLVDADSHTYGSFSAPEQTAGELVGLSQALANAEITGSGCSVKFMDKVTERSQIDGTTKSQISSWLQDGQSIKCDSSLVSHSKKADEPVKPNRKRPRPGESSRPRPKDRQMIQDRVKELREIVPNGAKCSIDALLERTIKHMLFLQSVTKHADKLKQTGESKLISKEGGLLCAFEVGSQSMVCPIIVEDLSHPRQMLVEMLCEERGFFLEIADIIRGLGLTILKGVMEARNEKVWARFAVEANRDVTRVEIFLSLVRLLEQTAKASVTQNGICDPVVQNACHQALPVTGLVESLQ